MANFGKHRSRVVDPVDPLQLRRIVAMVRAVSELPLSRSLPATPYTGPGVGLCYRSPVGTNVWIEFEDGNLNYPNWLACFCVRARCRPRKRCLPQ